MSDISDEEAILPAIGVLDDLDSDISFSDEDDPALQDYPRTNELKEKRGKVEAVALSQVVGAENENVSTKTQQDATPKQQQSDYTVKDAFWTEQRKSAAGIDEREAHLSAAEKAAISEKAKARDRAIVEGHFIPCPCFTISREGYSFEYGEHGSGYYIEQKSHSRLPSSWPNDYDGVLRIGLYKFVVK